MATVEVVPAEYTLRLTQDEVDRLRDILRGYVDRDSYSSQDNRAQQIEWITEALWGESVWDAPWFPEGYVYRDGNDRRDPLHTVVRGSEVR